MTKAEFKRRIQIITAICIVVFLALVIILVGQLISVVSLKNKENALAAEVERKASDQMTVEQMVEYSKTIKFLEQYAREVLGLKYPDEEAYIVEEN